MGNIDNFDTSRFSRSLVKKLKAAKTTPPKLIGVTFNLSNLALLSHREKDSYLEISQLYVANYHTQLTEE